MGSVDDGDAGRGALLGGMARAASAGMAARPGSAATGAARAAALGRCPSAGAAPGSPGELRISQEVRSRATLYFFVCSLLVTRSRHASAAGSVLSA